MGVLEKLGWRPPSSKDSGITDADTLFNETTIKHVKKFYDEEIRVFKRIFVGFFDKIKGLRMNELCIKSSDKMQTKKSH